MNNCFKMISKKKFEGLANVSIHRNLVIKKKLKSYFVWMENITFAMLVCICAFSILRLFPVWLGLTTMLCLYFLGIIFGFKEEISLLWK